MISPNVHSFPMPMMNAMPAQPPPFYYPPYGYGARPPQGPGFWPVSPAFQYPYAPYGYPPPYQQPQQQQQQQQQQQRLSTMDTRASAASASAALFLSSSSEESPRNGFDLLPNKKHSNERAIIIDEQTKLWKELDAHCKCDSLSEDGLREIIERHGLVPNNYLVSDYRFFFAACNNERVTEGIIQCLLEYFPDAASASNTYGQTSLHIALCNKHVTLNIVQLLIDAAPNSICSLDNDGRMPLHCLCDSENVNEIIAIEILTLLLEKHPKAVGHAAEDNGLLPVHIACALRSPDFCRVLIEMHPGSERLTDVNCVAPLHWACAYNTVATVEHLYTLHPDAINYTTPCGRYPIHVAIAGLRRRGNPTAAVDVVKFLLECDANVKFQKSRGTLTLLHFACRKECNDSNIEAALGIVKVLYDGYPEAIENNEIASNIHRYHQQVQAFINSQSIYSRQAKDHRLMMTPDERGYLPLHTALQDNVRLGSIVLLVKGNASAVQTPDNSGALPLHVACAHHESASVVQYLIGLDTTTLDAVDKGGNTALHLACRGAKYDTIALLLEKYDAVSVSKRNAQKKLPIDLLFESNEVLDRESVE
jgi:ankyrin repeat protein